MLLFLADTGKILSVGDWLEGLGLGRYENTLVANGFDDLDFLVSFVITSLCDKLCCSFILV